MPHETSDFRSADDDRSKSESKLQDYPQAESTVYNLVVNATADDIGRITHEAMQHKERLFAAHGWDINHRINVGDVRCVLSAIITNAITAIREAQPAAGSSGWIPAGVYYATETGDFRRISDHDSLGTLFYKQWVARAGEFPSRWSIYDQYGHQLGDEFVMSQEDALSSYASSHKITTVHFRKLQAIRR